MEEIKLSVTLGDILWIFGFVAAGFAFSKMIKEIKKPNEDLRTQVKENTLKLERDFQSFEKSWERYEIVIECLFVIINHELDGNSIDKLKAMRDKLQTYLGRN